MFRRLLLVALALSLASALPGSAEGETFRRHRDHVLGTSFDLVVVAETADTADAVETAILEEVDRLSAILNTYDESSEISRLNAVEATDISPELFHVISACEAFREQTGNALSCRIGGIVAAWSEAEQTGTPPSRIDMRLLAGQIRRADIALDEETGHVARPDGVIFDTNALAKGFIIDAALEVAKQAVPEAEGILLDIGGDLRAWGEGPQEGGWHVGIEVPAGEAGTGETSLILTKGSIATSGRGPRDRVIAGQAYGHVLSPFNGWAITGAIAASVHAEDAMTADALATALMAMPLDRGLDLVESLPGVESSVIAEDGRAYSSSGWANLIDGAVSDSSLAGPAWPTGYTFKVDLEIPEMDVADYERPYIAVWIADPDRNLVRILMLAGDDSRWMEENYYWFRRFGRKAGSLVDALSGPTRRPGEYTLEWDGFDHDGAPVPPGEYVLHLEAAREHGGHQHESIEMTLGEIAFTHELPGGEELGRISARFAGPDAGLSQ